MNGIERYGNEPGSMEEVSLCSLSVGEELFGIETAGVREVLGRYDLRTVPLTPAWIAGILPYRGEVLTTLSFRALLGRAHAPAAGCVLVLDDPRTGELWGLIADAARGVVMVRRDTHEPNPGTLDPRSMDLFDGVYRTSAGLIVKIDPHRLLPERIAATGLFGEMERRTRDNSRGCRCIGETQCAH